MSNATKLPQHVLRYLTDYVHLIIHDTCHFSPEQEQLAPVSSSYGGTEQLSMIRAGRHRARHGAGWGDGKTPARVPLKINIDCGQF